MLQSRKWKLIRKSCIIFLISKVQKYKKTPVKTDNTKERRYSELNHRYSHILSPVKIGNVVLKNRIFATKCISQELQGPENFPAESNIQYVEDLAKNGASMVVLTVGSFPQDRVGAPQMSEFDMGNFRVLRYFVQEVERVHAHNSLAIGAMMLAVPRNVNISDVRHPEWIKRPPQVGMAPKGMEMPEPQEIHEITKDEIRKIIDNFAEECVAIKTIGFDGVNIHMAYGVSLLAQSLSPVMNQRVDEYGGSLENRARLPMELFREIRRRCGPDFIIECEISGEEDMPNGYTVDDFVEYCNLFAEEKLVDIFEIRAKTGTLSHPTSFSCPEHYPITLKYAEAFKKRKINALCAPVGGFQDLDDIESFIADGRTDMVAMARAFICDPEYGKKLYEGRNDVVPCLRCDLCHGAVCAVNPLIGLNHVENKMYPAVPAKSKKVAVIGGGPAGMKAALVASQRGHDVTLYEASGRLGGQLIHADYMKDKWALRNYKNYLITELEKSNVKVNMNCKPDAKQLEAEGYDAIIAACGSLPKKPPVPGGDDPKVWAPIDCFGREQELGHDVIVIGGASTGAETALYLADSGHHVTLISRKQEILYDNVAHGKEYEVEHIRANPNMTIITNAKTLRVENGTDVVILVNDGPAPQGGIPQGPFMPDSKEDAKLGDHTIEKTLHADTVVFSAGVRPCVAECMEYADIAPEFYVIGDSNVHNNDMWRRFEMPKMAPSVGGNVKHCTETAYAAAMQL